MGRFRLAHTERITRVRIHTRIVRSCVWRKGREYARIKCQRLKNRRRAKRGVVERRLGERRRQGNARSEMIIKKKKRRRRRDMIIGEPCRLLSCLLYSCYVFARSGTEVIISRTRVGLENWSWFLLHSRASIYSLYLFTCGCT